MKPLSYFQFIQTLPKAVLPKLPSRVGEIRAHQPFRWIMQFYDYDKRIHYEVGKVKGGYLELGLHCESKDKRRNERILHGFWHNMFEIHEQLGESVSAEPWDRGWIKVYETAEIETLTPEFHAKTASRLIEIITCLHPILLELDR